MLISQNKKGNILQICLFFCAFFCTSPVLALVINGKVLSFYNLFFFLSLFVMIFLTIQKRRIRLVSEHEGKILLIWLCLATISSALGLLYYFDREIWYNNALTFFLRSLIYVIFIILVFNFGDNSNCILSGLKYGAVVNMIWVIIDAVYYYIFHLSLTNNIFSAYIVANNVRYGSIDTFDGGLIRPAGFNNDPASIGLFAPFILLSGLIEKKKWMIALAVMSLIFCGSNTAIACCAFSFVLYIVLFWKKNHSRQLSIKGMVSIIIVLCAVLFIVFRYYDVIISRVAQIITRFDDVYTSGEIENVRVKYVTQLPVAIMNQNIKFLTGTGFNSASEGFLFENINSVSLNQRPNLPFDVENLYVSYLLDNGIVGFGFFVTMLIKMYKRMKSLVVKNCKEVNVLAFAALVAMITSSVFYHYTLYSFHILMWCAICMIPNSLINVEDIINDS